MDFTQAKQRIEWLKAVLWENSRKYYVENAPTMSDYETMWRTRPRCRTTSTTS